MRILYVEDNMANVSLVRRIAGKDEVINYIDGEEALRNFDKDDPDLVLMDVQLAGRMTGLDVVKKLREDGCKLPIVAVTAYAMVGDRERCLAAGCDDYISKPLPIPRLVELFSERRKELESATKDEVPRSSDAVIAVVGEDGSITQTQESVQVVSPEKPEAKPTEASKPESSASSATTQPEKPETAKASKPAEEPKPEVKPIEASKPESSASGATTQPEKPETAKASKPAEEPKLETKPTEAEKSEAPAVPAEETPKSETDISAKQEKNESSTKKEEDVTTQVGEKSDLSNGKNG